MEGRSWLLPWLALLLVLFLLSVGWRNLPEEQPQAQYNLPLYEYTHDGEPTSITGGHVYRGEAVEPLVGKYVFGDFIHGKIWALERTDSGPGSSCCSTRLPTRSGSRGAPPPPSG